jgi:hypothetical protein
MGGGKRAHMPRAVCLPLEHRLQYWLPCAVLCCVGTMRFASLLPLALLFRLMVLSGLTPPRPLLLNLLAAAVLQEGCLVAMWVTNRERHRRFIDAGEPPGGLGACQLAAAAGWVRAEASLPCYAAVLCCAVLGCAEGILSVSGWLVAGPPCIFPLAGYGKGHFSSIVYRLSYQLLPLAQCRFSPLTRCCTLPAELLPGWRLRHLATWHWLKVTDAGQPVGRLDIQHRRPYESLLLCWPDHLAPPPAAPQAAAGGFHLLQGQPLVVAAVPPAAHSRKPHLAPLLQPLLPAGARCLEVGCCLLLGPPCIPMPLPPHFETRVTCCVCLQMFARELTSGWTSWGNEVLKFQGRRHLVPLDKGAI